MERLWIQSNRAVALILHELSRWTPSALDLHKRGHHPVTSTIEIQRKISDEQFEELRVKSMAVPRTKVLPRAQAIRTEQPPKPEDPKDDGILTKSVGVITSVVSTVASSKISLPTISGLIPESGSNPKKKDEDQSPAKFRCARISAIEKRIEKDTKRFVQDLDVSASTDYHYIARLQRLCSNLHHHPWVRHVALKNGAIEKLLHLRWRYGSEHPELMLQLNEALALVGFHDPPKGSGIKILSIDGGGMRGIVALEMLKAIELKTGKPIHELFDLICGVSTGSIIASFLGFHRFPIKQVEETYNTIGTKVFSQNFLEGAKGWVVSHSYYNTKLFEDILKTFVGTTRTIDTQRMFAQGPKVAIVSTLVSDERIAPFVFRNYLHPQRNPSNYKGSFTHPVWAAVRASTAAPGYFDDFYVDGMIHQDGGIMTNNATQIAIHEAQRIWPNYGLQCVISLGLGRTDSSWQSLQETKTKKALSLTEKFSRIVDSATDTELVHESLHDLIPGNIYYRFNPYLEEYLPLDETRAEKFKLMRESTNMYLRRNEFKLSQACKQLTKPKYPWDLAAEKLTEFYRVLKA